MDYSQFVGKPFEVISKVGLRYTGVFDHISQENQTICLADVYNQGSENRLERFVPGSAKSLGWVRFHTESIQSLNIIEKNGPPPGLEEPVDPSLASVSQNAPPTSASYVPPTIPAPAPAPAPAPQQPPTRHELPSKPPALEPFGQNDTASTALHRVRESLSELSTEPRQQRKDNRRRAQPIEVPDTEFDFSKGTETFERERAQRKTSSAGVEKAAGEGEDVGEPENAPHPSVLASLPTSLANDKPAAGAPAYSKDSFFDDLSATSSRVSRNEERHRNFDTFGEAGGSRGGGRGGRGGGYGGQRGGRGGGYGGQRRGGGGGRGGYNATPEWA